MKFLVKYTLRSLLLVVLFVFIYEMGAANYKYFTSHLDDPLVDNLKAFLKNSQHAVSQAIRLIHQGDISNIRLIKDFLYLFNNKIYWIVLALLILICYYQYNSRKIQEPIQFNSKVSSKQHKDQSQNLTKDQLSKLIKSQKFKQYIAKNSQQTIYPIIDVDQEEDQDFLKDWKQNQQKIFK